MLLTPVQRNPSRPRRALRLVCIAALTLAVHTFFVGLLVFASWIHWNHENKKTARAPARPVQLRGLSAAQFEKNRGPQAPPSLAQKAKTPEKAKEKDKRTPDKMPEGQIVDVAPGNNQIDENAKYVAETNNAAKKETKAREQTAFYRNAMPQRTAPKAVEGSGSADVEKAQLSGNEGLGDDERPKSESASKPKLQVPSREQQQEIALKTAEGVGPGVPVLNREESPEIKGNSDRFSLVPGMSTEGEPASAGRFGRVGILNLLPSEAVVNQIMGAAANDHLQDVDEGDGTYLSTREWKYASFFNRVKQSVGQSWNPTAQMRLRDPTGQIFGGRDRHTILTVTLDGTGRLKDAYVEKSSGLDFLDLEAVKAFERAQPFPNPPPGILANDQTVRFQFGFFLELSGRPGMRLFRSHQ